MAENMKMLNVKFEPLDVPIERRLQTLAAAIWMFVIAFGDLWGYILTAYLLFYTQTIRYFVLVYFVWMYYDWDTRNRGGRSEFWTKYARDNIFWRYFCDYFPLKLVKTADLDPEKLHLFINVPHGILSTGITGAFATDVLGCKELFSGLEMRMIFLDQHFKIPFLREYPYMTGYKNDDPRIGCCGSNTESIEYLLSTPPEKPYTGRATILVVGGIQETMESIPGKYRIMVNRRKGFVRLALKHGAPLVPVISFGETDLYDQLYGSEGSILRRLQNYIRKFIGLAPIIFWGRGFFQYSFGLIPNRAPVTVVVGSPIDLPKISEPSPEQINEYHEKFTKHLVELFETQKHNYIKNAETTVLELDA